MTNTLLTNSTLLLGALSRTGTGAAQDITTAEREQALHYLIETRAEVVGAVKGLSDAQWNFKPAPDRWSVHEILEHIAITEDLIPNGIRARLEKAPAPPAEHDAKRVDAMVLAKVPDRSTKVQAPPQLAPTGRWTATATLEHFLAGRRQTVNWLKSDTDLRGHVVDHPVLGALDGYEWILAGAMHSERHVKQILEVKADPNFPAQ